jgi:rhamnosyltransferase
LKDSQAGTPRDTKISIIIPTLNGGAKFVQCLEGIKEQEGIGPVELIVLDSESEDETKRYAAEAGARIIEIQRSGFNHGAVRDLGARSAGGEVYVFTVQDARPANAHWLCSLVKPLLRGAAGATSRILPRPEAHPLARRTALDSPLASGEPHEADPDRVDLNSLSPEALHRLARFDDVSSSIRADVYEQVPFRKLEMAEDLGWALDALKKGFKLVFASDSMIYHAHEYTPLNAYRRHLWDARILKQILSLRVRRNLGHAVKGYGYEVLRDFLFLWKHGPWALLRYGMYAMVLRGFQVAGQWKGSL